METKIKNVEPPQNQFKPIPMLVKRSSMDTISTEAVLANNLQGLEMNVHLSHSAGSVPILSGASKKLVKRKLKLQWNINKAYMDRRKKSNDTDDESVEDIFEISENFRDVNRKDLIDLIVQASKDRISKDEIEDVIVRNFDEEHVSLTILKKDFVSFELKLAEKTQTNANPFEIWLNVEKQLEKQYWELENKHYLVLVNKPSRAAQGLKAPELATVNPYEDTRVRLSPLPDQPPERDATFIDASFMHNGMYIAAAMPQNDIWREDFWRMTIEHNIRLIIMLNAVEERKLHHQAYYPNELNTPTHYGRITIVKKEQWPIGQDAVMRKIEVTNTVSGESILVTHLQYLEWPDFSVPQTDSEDFLGFIQRILDHQSKIEPPYVVHCFGGKGRTGTLITILVNIHDFLKRHKEHCLLNAEKSPTLTSNTMDEVMKFDIAKSVSLLRYDRALLIQTLEQFKLAYRIILMWVQRHKELSERKANVRNASQLPNVLKISETK